MQAVSAPELDKNLPYYKNNWPHELAGYQDYACIVAVFDSHGNIALVVDREGDNKKGFEPKLKLPGGKREAGELPPETASRELEEEIGLKIMPEELFEGLFHSEDRADMRHFRYWFVAFVPEFGVIRVDGVEGEEIHVRPYKEVRKDLEFLNSHFYELEFLFNNLYKDNA